MASLSKREQARNERELQDLLRQPGNSHCADCNARNPSWASWNLGIFLCMRCASIHRKLGTHISKVKSLSMDKWTTDQVESMKQKGNTASNKHFNPKNKKPDIPLDADEVDSAMERFIRKKYQEKSLVDGRPEPPSRADVSPSLTQSFQPPPTPELPPTAKKHKFFGFSLRTSSKKDRAGVQDAFKVTPVEYSPTSGSVREFPDRDLQEKLAQLRDMGFPDNERNMDILRRQGGDLERTIAMLVRLGPSEPSRQQNASPAPPRQQATAVVTSAPTSATASNNPWGQLDRPEAQSHQPSGFGLSFDAPKQQAPHQQPPQPNANPWQSAKPAQQTTGLEHQFSGMQVANPLFPHHTGGYAQSSGQDPRMQTMTPPVPSVPQQYGYTASPTSNTSNPFYQQPLSSQSTGNNPFYQQQQSQPVFAPKTNPFMAMQQAQSQTGQTGSTNPFGLPPAQQQQYMQSQPAQTQQQNTNPFGIPSQALPPAIQQSQTFPSTQQQSSPFGQQQSQPQSPQSQIPNFNYGQPQQQPQPYFQQPQQPQPQQQQAYYQNQQLQPLPHQSQSQPLQAQPTGRYTKTDIMSLFNQPASYAQQALPSVQEAYDDPSAQQQQQAHQQIPQQQHLSPAPSNNPYGALGMGQAANSGKRSATMPVMGSMHSSGGTGSRNPFLSQQPSSSSMLPPPNSFGQAQQTQAGLPVQGGYPGQGQISGQLGPTVGWNQGARHASNESVSVNNPSLMDGRHSPDAFASLSARY